MRGGDGSFQVVWRTDLEVDLKRTQNKTLLWKGINVKIKVLFYYALLLFYVAVYAFTEQMHHLHCLLLISNLKLSYSAYMSFHDSFYEGL